MQRIEHRVNVRNKHLRRQARKQALRIRPQIARDLRALPDAHILEQAKDEQREHLHVLANSQLRARTGARGRHTALVRL